MQSDIRDRRTVYSSLIYYERGIIASYVLFLIGFVFVVMGIVITFCSTDDQGFATLPAQGWVIFGVGVILKVIARIQMIHFRNKMQEVRLIMETTVPIQTISSPSNAPPPYSRDPTYNTTSDPTKPGIGLASVVNQPTFTAC